MNVIHLVSNKEWGGGERYALDLCNALRADSHNVTVFTRRKPDVAQPFINAGLHGGFLRLGGVLDVLTPVRLARFIRSLEGRTVIHVHNFKDAQTALNARCLCGDSTQIRVVCTRHLVRPAKTDSSHLRTLGSIDAIVFVSELAREVFASTLPVGFDKSKLHVVHNSIAADPVEPAESTGDTCRIIYAGRIAPEKGIDTLLNALALNAHRKWQLRICGTGTARHVADLSRLADSLQIDSRIDWKGHVTDIFAELAQNDVLVLPSTARESFGLVILEAFSRGLPVITTDNGAQREIVRNGVDGLLVPPGDPKALADALALYIDSPDARAAAGRAAHSSFISEFQYNRFYNKILDIYNGC